MMGISINDMAANANLATLYQSFTDLESLQKRRLEAKEVAMVHNVFQIGQISKNKTWKRAHNGDTLRSWLIGARNAKHQSIGAKGK